jgi:hypothetical protein
MHLQILMSSIPDAAVDRVAGFYSTSLPTDLMADVRDAVFSKWQVVNQYRLLFDNDTSSSDYWVPWLENNLTLFINGGPTTTTMRGLSEIGERFPHSSPVYFSNLADPSTNGVFMKRRINLMWGALRVDEREKFFQKT